MASVRRTRQPSLRASVRLSVLLCVLVGVNVYVFFLRGGSSLKEVMKVQATQAAISVPFPAHGGASSSAQGGRLGALAPEEGPNAASGRSAKNAPGGVGPAGGPVPASVPPVPATVMDDEDAQTLEGKIVRGDTLVTALTRLGVQAGEAELASRALSATWDVRKLQEGQGLEAGLDAESHLRSLMFHAAPLLTIQLVRDEAGKFTAKRIERKIDTKTVEVGATIRDSLYQTLLQKGESPALVGLLADLFAWDLNFFVDTHPGDRVRLVVEKRYAGDRFFGYGRILAAEYIGRESTHRAFWFDPGPGAGRVARGGYFNEHGESVVKSLLRTPLKFVRISSKFDRHRLHPILHTERAHLGVDYAAPVGTPVWASGRGRVVFVGPRPGSGNTVIIDHGSGLETRYYHLSRFAKGLRPNQSVSQKQVIGYVGTSGLSTGPHLHFSVRSNGAYVDPNKMKLMRDAPVSASLSKSFRSIVDERIAALRRIAESAELGQN